MAAKVAMMDKGSASEGMIVARTLRRNRKITSTTRTMASNRVFCTSATASRTETERSFSTSIPTEPGSWARNWGRRSRTSFTTCTVLASGLADHGPAPPSGDR